MAKHWSARMLLLGLFPLIMMFESSVAAQAAQLPSFQLPWPLGTAHDIEAGNTYGCGDHTSANGDYYSIDFNFSLDDPIAAAGAGTVTEVETNPDAAYGEHVTVDHGGGFTTLYGHMDFPAGIAVGQHVAEGQVLGYGGRTGHATGVHLHFRMQKDGFSYRPEPMSQISHFGYYGFSTQSGLGCDSYRTSPTWTSFDPGLFFTSDATGDARSEMILFDTDHVRVLRSLGGSFSEEAWTTNPYFGSKANGVADVTGDFKADAIVVNDTSITVRRSTGTAFSGNETWFNAAYYGARGTFFADVNGDYRADAIVVNDDKIYVKLSTGSAFGSTQAWTTGAFYGARGTFFADVNGDNRADAIEVNDDKIYVKLSNGSAFGSTQSWTSGPFWGNRGTFFADLNADGEADAIVSNDDTSGVTVRLSTGSGFGSPQSWTTPNAYYGIYGTFIADVTGEGNSDAIANNTTSMTVRRSTGSPPFNANETWYSGRFH